MPDTYTYEVRDQSGKTISGTIVADSQALVLERLKEQGMVPVKVALQKKVGLKMEFNVRTKVKLKDLAIFSRQFSTMVSSGLPMLRALATLENQTSSKALATAVSEVRQDVERGSSLSAVDGQAPEGLQQPVRRHGEVGRDRWCPGRRPGPAGRQPRAGGLAARPHQVGDDLPDRGPRLRHADHDGDAAVHRSAVQEHLRRAARDRCRCRRASCSRSATPSAPSSRSSLVAIARHRLPVQAVEEDRRTAGTRSTSSS